ncbi:RNI-like protein [Aspergillus indologenus CBS 114.80]|uniref:RNI-like protein n=1 Tax=Aspergillus indologenus CBS 114.80 TaxID=1450541 RepID=A0A2V5JIJ7_9EURO|nr:RNI-like protein [Aspergillus indologenus CBS 114.80]
MTLVIRSEGDSLQQRGQLLFKQGNYQGALDAFTEALSCKKADVMSILDNRAATYIKLAQYDRALTDSRNMVRKDTKDGRGILRYGQVLLLTGDRAKALKAYGYGLKSLSSDNPRRKLVLQMYCKVRDAAAVKRLDPFSVLPLEVAMMVLRHLTFREIVICTRVSKGWQQFLSLQDLWMRLDLSEARRKATSRSIRTYIQRSRAMLTHAMVTNIATTSHGKVLEYLSRCPKLESLEIGDPIQRHDGLYDHFKSCKQLKTLVIAKGTPVSQENIANFLASLTNLERLEIHNAQPSPETKVRWPAHLPNLRSITLATEGAAVPPPGRVAALYLPAATASQPCTMPNLEEIRIDSYPKIWSPYTLSFDPNQFPKLRKLELKGVFIGNFALPPTLEHLSIHAGTCPTGQVFPFPFDQSPHLRHLHTLILRDLDWVTHNTLRKFLVTAEAPIRKLVVASCPRLDHAQLERIFTEHPVDLTELGICALRGATDMSVKALVRHLPHLYALDVSATDVTGRLVRTFADPASSSSEVLPRLKYLNVAYCEHVLYEAVAYGRAHNINVVTR